MTIQQLKQFDKAWSHPRVTNFGLEQREEAAAKEFAHKFLNDANYRNELQQKFMQIFLAKDKSESGLIEGREGHEFI